MRCIPGCAVLYTVYHKVPDKHKFTYTVNVYANIFLHPAWARMLRWKISTYSVYESKHTMTIRGPRIFRKSAQGVLGITHIHSKLRWHVMYYCTFPIRLRTLV
jgi:hypothetical protein